MFNAFRILFTGGLLGKALGVIREVLVAWLLGTGPVIAAYRVAQTSVLVPINFFTADVLTAAVIPLCKRYRQESTPTYDALVVFLVITFGLFATGVSLLAYIHAPLFVHILAPGLEASTAAIAASFVQVMALGIPPYLLGGLCSYLEMANGVYALAAARASIQSTGMIAGTVLAFVWSQPLCLAWGFTLASTAFFFLSAIRLQRDGMLPARPHLSISSARRLAVDIWHIVRPLAALPFLLQGNIVAERWLASYMGTTAVAALDYAKFVTETGIILIAVPLGLAGLSTLSGLARTEVDNRLAQLVPMLLIVTIPASAFLGMNAHQVVHLLYERGAFSADSSVMTTCVLQGLSLGLWAQVVAYVLVKVLNAQLRNGDVLRLSVVSIIVNLVINVSFARWLGPATLGMSISLAAVVMSAMLIRTLSLTMFVTTAFVWLGCGAGLYLSLCANLLPREADVSALLCNAAFAVGFWVLFVRFTPPLYVYVGPFFENRTWRLA